MMLEILQNADPVLYFLGLSSAVKLSLYYKWLGARPRDKPEHVGHVTDFCLYPLKSGHGVSIKELSCTFQEGPHSGYTTDRHYMVADANNALVNYAMAPRLSTLRSTCGDGSFTLAASGRDLLVVNTREVEESDSIVTVSAYGTTVRGLDCGDSPAAWINSVLDTTGYRLIYAPTTFDTQRSVPIGNKKFADWVKLGKDNDLLAFQSVTPYHVITEESLVDLNSRLATPVGMDRFRANIVVKGDNPYSEDTWKEMYIGNTRFSTIKLTGRCLFTTIDPDTGVKGQEPLKTLNSYRQLVPNDPVFGPCMGIHMVLEAPGTIKIGDPVYIVRGDNTVKP